MIRALRLLTGVAAGLVVGAGLVVTLEGTATDPELVLVAPEESPAGPQDEVLLAWTPNGLPPALPDAVATLQEVEAVTAVRGDLIGMVASRDAEGGLVDQAPDGMVVPLDAVGVDPASYSGFLPKSAAAKITGLRRGDALLSATSARLRRLTTGGRLELESGATLTVTGVVDDTLVGGAEVVIATSTAAATGVTTERYLLIRHRARRVGIEQAVRQLLPDGITIRFRSRGETPFLRHGDAVLPQALLKEQLGEFAIRAGEDLVFEQDPDWQEENLVRDELPIVGKVTCHRTIVPLLKSALGELEERNLSFLVDPAAFGGCWNPRFIESRGAISRHAWGSAVDLNSAKNPTGLTSVQDPRLVEVMQRSGFAWGGPWLVPDPAHFEWVQTPR